MRIPISGLNRAVNLGHQAIDGTSNGSYDCHRVSQRQARHPCRNSRSRAIWPSLSAQLSEVTSIGCRRSADKRSVAERHILLAVFVGVDTCLFVSSSFCCLVLVRQIQYRSDRLDRARGFLGKARSSVQSRTYASIRARADVESNASTTSSQASGQTGTKFVRSRRRK